MDFAGLEKKHLLADFGCGNGQVLMAAVEEFGCRAIGLEKDKRLADVAVSRIRESGLVADIDIIHGSDPAEIADADIVFAFLPANIIRGAYDAVSGLENGSRTLVIHEQSRLDLPFHPDASRLLVSDDAITVAHRWHL